jgi:hypothetical protein
MIEFTQEISDQNLVWAIADAEAEGRLEKGTYGKQNGKFRGCSIGCMLNDFGLSADEIDNTPSVHRKLEELTGIPEWLLRLQDEVFEGLPEPEHQAWHRQVAEAFAKAPKPVDWQSLLHRVHVGILRVSYKTAGSAQEAVQNVIDLHERAMNGEQVGDEEWSAAESAAWSAAWSAARSAAFQEIRDAILEAISALEEAV